MLARRFFGFLPLVLVVACGDSNPPPVTPPPVSSTPAPIASSTSTPSATPATPPVDASPTALSESDRARDRAREPAARAVVDAYANWNGFFSSTVAEWSADSKHFVFGSMRDGLPELYLGDESAPSAAPLALTKGPERAIWGRTTPDGKWLLYLRDAKGNEHHHVWRAALDGSNAVDLTPTDLLRNEPIVPKQKPDTMYFSARTAAAPETTIYVQNIVKGDARAVYTSKRPAGLVDVSADGSRALVGDEGSPGDAVLTEVDIASGKSHRLYPPEGKKASNASAAYTSDGARVILTTDEGGEASVLIALDAKTGKEVGRYVNEAPKTASLFALPSPKGDVIAVLLDAGNHGELRLLDAKKLTLLRNVKVPLGDIHLGTFRPDGKELSILISEPDHPSDPFAVDVATGNVKPLRADPRSGLDALGAIDVSLENVQAVDGLTIPINRYLPKNVAPGTKLPTIAIFHGGPSTSYAVRWSPYARFFVSIGYAVLEPNVRGSTGFGRAYEAADNREKRADWLKDLASVNAWAKSQPWCDPSRVIVWGQSYGGYTTLMALTRQPDLWRAGVDLYGVADLKQFLRTTDASIRAYFVEEFGDLDKDGPLLDAWSPMRDVDKIVSPLFVYAGKNDPRVPLSESDTIVRALRQRKIPVEYMVADNEGHTVDRRETKIELLTRTARFLEDATKSPVK